MLSCVEYGIHNPQRAPPQTPDHNTSKQKIVIRGPGPLRLVRLPATVGRGQSKPHSSIFRENLKPALQPSHNELSQGNNLHNLTPRPMFPKYGIRAASAASIRLLYICASARVAPLGGPITATPLRVLCQLLLCIPVGDDIYVIMSSAIGAYLCIALQNDSYLVRVLYALVVPTWYEVAVVFYRFYATAVHLRLCMRTSAEKLDHSYSFRWSMPAAAVRSYVWLGKTIHAWYLYPVMQLE